MTKMAKIKALDASCRNDWISPSFSRNTLGMMLINEYLLMCPVPGTTANPKTAFFYENKDDGLALRLLNEIRKRISFMEIKPELRQVARWLTENKKADNCLPRKTEEFICCSSTSVSVLKRCYGLFPDIEVKDIKADSYGPYKNLLQIDAIFRHIRNSIAHGQFRETTRKNPETNSRMPYFFMQDSNQQHQITARMFLSRRSLEFISDLVKENGNERG